MEENSETMVMRFFPRIDQSKWGRAEGVARRNACDAILNGQTIKRRVKMGGMPHGHGNGCGQHTGISIPPQGKVYLGFGSTEQGWGRDGIYRASGAPTLDLALLSET
jgi:hypothetical protein